MMSMERPNAVAVPAAGTGIFDWADLAPEIWDLVDKD
jgi:hypothetical protein